MITPKENEMIDALDPSDAGIFDLVRGEKNYELSNHLGNVLSVVTDAKVGIDSSGMLQYYLPRVIRYSDYYPFGSAMKERTWSGDYRYGFNCKEVENEFQGKGNEYDFGARIYDPRIARFFSVDRFTNQLSWNSTYGFANNCPILGIDENGDLFKVYASARQAEKFRAMVEAKLGEGYAVSMLLVQPKELEIGTEDEYYSLSVIKTHPAPTERSQLYQFIHKFVCDEDLSMGFNKEEGSSDRVRLKDGYDRPFIWAKKRLEIIRTKFYHRDDPNALINPQTNREKTFEYKRIDEADYFDLDILESIGNESDLDAATIIFNVLSSGNGNLTKDMSNVKIQWRWQQTNNAASLNPMVIGKAKIKFTGADGKTHKIKIKQLSSTGNPENPTKLKIRQK